MNFVWAATRDSCDMTDVKHGATKFIPVSAPYHQCSGLSRNHYERLMAKFCRMFELDDKSLKMQFNYVALRWRSDHEPFNKLRLRMDSALHCMMQRHRPHLTLSLSKGS